MGAVDSTSRGAAAARARGPPSEMEEEEEAEEEVEDDEDDDDDDDDDDDEANLLEQQELLKVAERELMLKQQQQLEQQRREREALAHRELILKKREMLVRQKRASERELIGGEQHREREAEAEAAEEEEAREAHGVVAAAEKEVIVPRSMRVSRAGTMLNIEEPEEEHHVGDGSHGDDGAGAVRHTGRVRYELQMPSGAKGRGGGPREIRRSKASAKTEKSPEGGEGGKGGSRHLDDEGEWVDREVGGSTANVVEGKHTAEAEIAVTGCEPQPEQSGGGPRIGYGANSNGTGKGDHELDDEINK